MFKRLLGASLLLCVALVAFAAPASGSKLVTGVSYVTEPDPVNFERVKATGGTFVHGWVRWKMIAPAVEPESWDPRDPMDPNYNWVHIDNWVINAVNAGLTPLLQTYYAPTWANRCEATGSFGTDPPCNPDPDKMADFGYALAKRFSGEYPGLPRVRYWQPQNEPNLSVFFQPQRNAKGQVVSASNYRTLLNRYYTAVKSVHRSNKILSAGLAPNGNSAAVAPMEFARKLFCMTGRTKPKPTSANCKVKLDIFDMHPYTSGGPTHKGYGQDNVQLGDLPKLKALLLAADKAGRIHGDSARTPLWATEMAWDSKGPDPGGVPMNLLKRWTSEAAFRVWQAGIDHFFWYSLRDQDPGNRPWSESTQAGLYFRGATIQQDRAKPIVAAYRFPFVAFTRDNGRRKGMTVWGRTPTSKPGWVVIERKRGARWVNHGRVRANANGVFRKWVRITNGSNRQGNVRARFGKELSVPFSLKRVKDRPVRPFG